MNKTGNEQMQQREMGNYEMTAYFRSIYEILRVINFTASVLDRESTVRWIPIRFCLCQSVFLSFHAILLISIKNYEKFHGNNNGSDSEVTHSNRIVKRIDLPTGSVAQGGLWFSRGQSYPWIGFLVERWFSRGLVFFRNYTLPSFRTLPAYFTR